MGDIHGLDGAPRRALMYRAVCTAVLLSLLFAIVYGATNWLTAQRPASHVMTWHFAWELGVPYLPLSFLPYMSLDLFFFGAPFLCRDERELRVFAKRIGFSILTAAAFFLLLPLKLAWPAAPEVSGWFGDFVAQSSSMPFLMEYPHNLFPSLHIAQGLVVADVYGRRTRGAVRVLMYAWFLLIGVSTLTTWQHHAVDVAGGVVLAGFAFYLFRETDSRLPVVPNFRIGSYYAAGAAVVLGLAAAVWPWGVFLLWPAAGLGIVATAYYGMGPGIFRKECGHLPLSARFVFAPVLIGQQLSLAWYRRQCRAWDEVAPGVLIGRVLTESEAAEVVQQGVTAVLDLTAEFSEAAPLLAARYRNLPILDLTAPTQEQLQEAVSFIAEEAANGDVFVHCKIGYSRSAAVVGAYLLGSRNAATAQDAIARLRHVRPTIIVRPEAKEALHEFSQQLT